MVLARLAGALGATDLLDAVPLVPGAAASAMESSDLDGVEPPGRLLAIVGAGPAGVSAREGALKLREAARFPAEGYDVEYLLHGSAVPLSADDHLVWLSPPDSDGLVSGVARAAEAEHVRVTSVTESSNLPVVLAQIPLTIRLQLLALRFVQLRGQDPDTVIVGAWDDHDLWSTGGP